MSSNAPSRAQAQALDARDALAPLRDRFHVPESVIYLDGNSLGALPKATATHIDRVIREEWGNGLIRSWNDASWFPIAERVGAKIARLIGAAPGEVVAADSTSVNLFKVLAVALRLRPGRAVILSERDNFPTDLYIAQGLADLLGGRARLELQAPNDDDAIVARIAAHAHELAVVMLTHVDYRTGAMHDMVRITRAAHEAGALMIWDLAHSAGAVPVELNAAGADFAVGCSYKYLNGGPGAPAFLFVAQRHQSGFIQPLSGWMGHARPFDFAPGYAPAEGVARFLCGTPSVIAMSAVEVGVDLMAEASIAALREKSLALADLFIRAVGDDAARLGLDLRTPREPARRGSQVSFGHAQGYPVMQALIARGVIGDFRAPDILRFGFAPLYLRYVDVWDAAAALREVLETRAWDRPEFHRRQAVT
jgi:kynureninase